MAEDHQDAVPNTIIRHDERLGIHLAFETNSKLGCFVVYLQVRCRCCTDWSTPAVLALGMN